MTEIDRIKSEGWLPENFWNEEVRDEYLVTAEMKKVWAIEMDLYRELARALGKHNLRYFADGGTTLGAIRHKGFIPWDDDFDICMPRADYEKLQEFFADFKEPYFLQTTVTDPEYGYSFMRLRNSNTSVVVKPFTHAKFNQGLYIDIFPLDNATIEDIAPRMEKINKLILKNSAYMRKDYPDKSERDLQKLRDDFDPNMKPIDVWNAVNKEATADNHIETGYWSPIVTTFYDPLKNIYPKSIFDDYKDVPFETISIRVPAGYHEMLTAYFGNYMEFPPVEKRGTWHNMEFYPEVPYKQLYKEKFGVEM
ncbi:MAG: LicD family protein [Fibrobacteraceae bacterium]|nr:LicD family protein [Fibrobacteraceae bacterium]